jgi:cell shape-determining protein MreC
MVGEIRKVDKKEHGIFQQAELVPGVDLRKLEEVLVIAEFPLLQQEDKGKKVKKSSGRVVPKKK